MRKVRMAAALALSLILTSCSGQPSNPGVAVEEKEGEELVIGVCIYDFKDDFMGHYKGELEQYLTEKYGAKVDFMDGRNSMEIQNQQLEEYLKKDPDAVIVNPVEALKTSALVDMCARRGVPAVIINREPPEEEIRRWKEEKIAACYIGTDRAQAGTYQGEIILDTPSRGDMNGDGKVSCIMITGDDGNPDAWYRRENARKALEGAGLAVEILFEQSGEWQGDEGKRLAALGLSRYGEQAEVIFCGNDAMAIGAERAIQEAGRTVGKDIYLVGVDALREAVALVREGRMTGTVFNDYAAQAHMAGEAAAGMAKGDEQELVSRASYIKIVMGE